jgi:tetratricopeptide (TPR) repeat protein
MRFRERLSNILSKTIVIYAVAAGILFAIGNQEQATIERLDALAKWGDYPAKLERDAARYNEQELYFAIRYYKFVRNFLPDSGQPYAVIGYCYARLGKYEQAIKYYKQALDRNNTHFWLDYNLGMLYYQVGDHSRAYASFQRITIRNINALKEASILVPLFKIADEKGRELSGIAHYFTHDLREKSFQMLVRINLEQEHYLEAAETALAAANDPLTLNKDLFLLYARTAAYGTKEDKNAAVSFPIPALAGLKVNKVVVLHPWAFYIQPGKESSFLL